jgi:hypothetical protein
MSPDERLEALERQVAALSAEVRALRAAVAAPSPQRPASEEEVRERLRHAPRATAPRVSAQWLNATAAVSGEEIESLVGRYGTLALAALVILMAVGAIIKMAVQRGLLTPEVRILAGSLVAVALAGAGMMFRARGDVRYGGVLLALALAVVDLVAWGAGPRFHLVPSSVALTIVDVASILLAVLALHDASEFLFLVALGGALSAPFVATNEHGTVSALLGYGTVVLVGGVRGGRHSSWWRVFALIVAAALVYSLAAAALPTERGWYGPFLIVLFPATLAAAALLIGEAEWRSELPRALMAVAVIGMLTAIDVVARRPFGIVLAVSIVLVLITHAALLVRNASARAWRASALLLPCISLGVVAWAVEGWQKALVIAGWSAMSLGMWQAEVRRANPYRSATHLLAAGLLGSLAVTSWVWGTPLAFVAGLAAWGVTQAAMGQREASPLPLIGVAVSVGGAALSAIDQLASRNAFGYTPFMTRSSLSALVAAVGLLAAGELVQRGAGGAARLADRPVKLGIVIGFLIVWGRMEVANAFSPDLAAFLLTSYYAACGVGSIVAGRMLEISRLRVAGLALAIYAAVKAVIEVTNISSLALRVGAYAAVGIFLLGAGYLYRDRSNEPRDVLA